MLEKSIYFCDICASPIKESRRSNLGVQACRSCAAFFRRTIAENLRYTCRNDESCQLRRGMRKKCRACRIKRCYEIGMNREDLKSVVKISANEKTNPQTVPDFIRAQEPYPMLSWIGKGLKKLQEVQRSILIAQDLMLDNRDRKCISKNNITYQYRCLSKFDYEYYNYFSGPIIYSALGEFFLHFNLLDHTNKAVFFGGSISIDGFHGLFRLLQQAYFTSKLFPHDENKIWITHGYALDLQPIKEQDLDYLEPKNEYKNLMTLVLELWDRLMQKFATFDLDDIEFVFLVCLQLAITGKILVKCRFRFVGEYFTQTKDISSKWKSSIFDEIYAYYHKKYDIKEVAIRFGRLFNVYDEISKTYDSTKEATILLCMSRDENLIKEIEQHYRQFTKKVYAKCHQKDGNKIMIECLNRVIAPCNSEEDNENCEDFQIITSNYFPMFSPKHES